MEDFFRNVPVDEVIDIEAAARVIYDLRENRAAILNGHGVHDETELLERIADGSLPEHPAYDSYLSAGIVAETREFLRRQLERHLAQVNGTRAQAIPMEEWDFSPLAIKRRLEEVFSDRIEGEVLAARDAVLFKLDNGVIVELKVLSPTEYAFGWLWGEATLRIDTAPGADRAASHFHDLEGDVRPDPVTVPGRDPWENIDRLVKALLADPLLA
ncbi:MAG TPA: hypothetical protein VFF03_09170 [Rhodocyclaceae bacterium]|nr:hypothetical protein [Rhodocyclaceae bacterium]